MKNKHAVRFGTETSAMRPMTKDDILVSRLNLLIIMAKAFLKSYPMGEFRRKAIEENAAFVFYETLVRTRSTRTPLVTDNQSQSSRQGLQRRDHLFLLRAQLLAVMVTSFVQKKSEGNFRKKAMAANIDHISEYLADGIQSGDPRILKVA
jgi:hypothetical protein